MSPFAGWAVQPNMEDEGNTKLSVRTVATSLYGSDIDDEDDWADARRLGTRNLLLGVCDFTNAEDESDNCLAHLTPKLPSAGPTLLSGKRQCLQSCQQQPRLPPVHCNKPDGTSSAPVHSYRRDGLVSGDSESEEDLLIEILEEVMPKVLDRDPPQSGEVPEARDSAAPNSTSSYPLCDWNVRDSAAPNSTSFVPPLRLERGLSIPRPRSITSARQTPQKPPLMMAPMLRARHMEILDQQYLNDTDARPEARSAQRCRASTRHGRTQSAGPPGRRVTTTCSKGPSQRQLGPKAVMPMIKGWARIRAEFAQREVDKEKREARLKEQFRSKLSTPRGATSQVPSKRTAN